MKLASVVALAFGLALFTALIAWQGVATIGQVLAVAGWKLLWLGPLYLVPLALAAQSWRLLFAPGEGPAATVAARLGWIGLAVNWLLPVAQIGGEVAKARLLIKRGFAGATATASVVVDKTVQGLTIPLYALLGLGLFAFRRSGEEVVLGGLAFVVLLGAAVFAFYRMQRAGLFATGAKIADRLVPWRVKADLGAGAEKLDAAVHAIYRRRGRFALACLWRLLFHLALAAELWLILLFLGHPVSLADAVILESLGTAVIAAAFIVPGGLGIQEGGFMVLGAAIGIGPDVALAMSLSKRVRELIIGLPGLVAWQVMEGRELLRRRPGR